MEIVSKKYLSAVIGFLVVFVIGFGVYLGFHSNPGKSLIQKVTVNKSSNHVSPTPIRTVSKNVSAQTVHLVKVYLIAIEDNGKSGKKIGCGDSLVSVQKSIQPTTEPIQAALSELFAIKDKYYGQSGLYNSLYNSDLHVANVIAGKGMTSVELTGGVSLDGECDNPRFDSQVKETVRQFAPGQQITILINGKNLDDLLSQQ